MLLAASASKSSPWTFTTQGRLQFRPMTISELWQGQYNAVELPKMPVDTVATRVFDARSGIQIVWENLFVDEQAGLNRLSLYDNLATLAINIGLNFLLIPTYGIEGAAVAWTVSLVVVNAARAIQVRQYIVPTWPFNEGTPKALAAFTWSVLVGLVVRELVDGSPRAELFLATPIVFGVYAVLLVALGLTEEDRLVFGDLLSTLRRGGRRGGRPYHKHPQRHGARP